MSATDYWVVGGEFGSLNFHKLVPGTQQVSGPYKTRAEAEEAWKRLSEERRHECNVRFTIVKDSGRNDGSAVAA